MPVNKILNNFKYLKTGIWYFLAKRDPLLTVMIGLTYNCHCDCPHCAMAIYEKNREKELSTSEWLEVISRFPKNKVRRVYFFGGEPLLKPDIFELIGQARKKGLRTAFDTNGYLLTKEIAEKLKKAGLNLIGVSIDSSDPETHNRLRGIGNLFKKATEGIKYCLKEGIRCCLSTYATKEKIESGELQRIISLGKMLGVTYVRILSPISTGRWLEEENKKLNFQERKLLNDLRKFGFVHLEEDFCLSMNKRLVYISPYGEVQPCWSMPFNFGNIKKTPLEEILKRMWNHSIFKVSGKICPMNNEEFRRKYLGNVKTGQKFPVSLV